MNDTEIETAKAVARGAAWLDETKPGWAELIDTKTLTMSDAHNCIAGQVFRKEAMMAGRSHGFDHLYYNEEHSPTWLKEHAFLFAGRDLWLNEIEARMEEMSA